MDGFINEARKNSRDEGLRKDSEEFEDLADPRIVVVGCGGAGNNTIHRLHNIGIEGAETVAINTDKQDLQAVDTDTSILVGKDLTKGLGAGGQPEKGMQATRNASETIREVLNGADLVFVTAGMGGGTGTGASPVVAEIAKDMGAIVVGMVSMPFEVEGARQGKAEEGIKELKKEADSIIVLDNDRLLDYVPNLPVGEAFSVMDQIIAETVKGISETITQNSLINLDYADVDTIMSEGGVAIMLVGETQDDNKQKVVDEALTHPLLDVDYRGATGGLVHITGGPDLTLTDAEGIAKKITQRLDSDANVIWGSRIRDERKGEVRVMAIMTGIESDNVLNSDSSMSENANFTSANDIKNSEHTNIDTI